MGLEGGEVTTTMIVCFLRQTKNGWMVQNEGGQEFPVKEGVVEANRLNPGPVYGWRAYVARTWQYVEVVELERKGDEED